jgi:hypothetical protein
MVPLGHARPRADLLSQLERWLEEVHEQPGLDVTFTRTDSGATQLVLVHRGLAALRPDRPVRHGEPIDVFIGRLGR